MPTDDHDARQLKKLRTKEKLLGLALGIIPLAATALYFIFDKNKPGRPMLGIFVVMEWLVLLFVYLIVLSKMRRRRR